LLHEEVAHGVDDQNFAAIGNAEFNEAASRGSCWKIDGANKILITGNVGDDFALIPNMVAGGNDIDTVFVEFFAEFFGDAKAVGGVFTITDRDVGGVFFFEGWEMRFEGFTAAAAKDVAYE